jgi:hypothetical protein
MMDAITRARLLDRCSRDRMLRDGGEEKHEARNR